ncbi:hypothetical protein [Alkalimarinus coralli]|uniref:hypothetical protein n=1 Tax=Alkalimarinus coralli TaxID=2935863 RepID=UPI00202AC389|nr:hypothetical protein [Alkalimarinus coralli]
MNIKLNVKQLITSVAFIFLLASSAFGQEQSAAGLQHFKSQKPLILEIRFCACKGLDMESEASAPSAEFMTTSSVIQVALSKTESGFLATDQLSFGYSLSPYKDTGSFLLRYSAELTQDAGSLSAESELLIELDRWLTIADYQNESNHGNKYTSIAIRVYAS